MKFNSFQPVFPAALAASVSLALPLSAYVAQPYSTEFVADERYQADSLDDQNRWNVLSGTAQVVQPSEQEGYVRLEANTAPARIGLDFAVPGPEVLYVSFDLRPVADADLLASTLVDLDRSALRFKRIGDRGYVYVLHGDGFGGVSWLPTEASFPVESSGISEEFLTLTLSLDYGRNAWDLWLGERLEEIEISFDIAPPDGLASIVFAGHDYEDTELSNLRVSPVPPNFLGKDANYEEDRLASEERVGETYRSDGRQGHRLPAEAGSEGGEDHRFPVQAGSPTGPSGLIYVNNQLGNDANDGRAARPSAAGGPKATIQAAVRSAKERDRIVVDGPGLPGYRTKTIPAGTTVKAGVRIGPASS